MLEAYNDLCRLLGLVRTDHAEPDRRQVLELLSTADARILSIKWTMEELEKRALARGINPKPDPYYPPNGVELQKPTS